MQTLRSNRFSNMRNSTGRVYPPPDGQSASLRSMLVIELPPQDQTPFVTIRRGHTATTQPTSTQMQLICIHLDLVRAVAKLLA